MAYVDIVRGRLMAAKHASFLFVENQGCDHKYCGGSELEQLVYPLQPRAFEHIGCEFLVGVVSSF
jgi:hypothetical protein